MNNIWFDSASIGEWGCPQIWNAFISGLEGIFSSPVTHLGWSDPPPKVEWNLDRGESIVGGIDDKRSRNCFIKLQDNTLVTITFRGVVQRDRANFCMISAPQKEVLSSVKVLDLVSLYEKTLAPFYAYIDYKSVATKKVASPPSLSVDYQRELMGVFWVTYFDRRYKEFFSKGLEKLPCELVKGLNDGVLLVLAETPDEVEFGLRARVEDILGKSSFAENEIRSDTSKDIGQYVLTYAQLAQ